MASRRFFQYNPYDDYYYAAPPANYTYPYYIRSDQFPTAEPPAARPRPAATVIPKPRRKTVSIPVVGPSDPEPAAAAAAPAPKIRKPALSAEVAAVRIQAAARGFLARKAVRALRAVEREAEEIGVKVACDAEALSWDGMARVAVCEQLMRLLFRLDAVRCAREYRRRVAKRVLALQDAVDALEQPRPEPAAAEEAPESEVTQVDEVPEDNESAPEQPGAAEHTRETESKAPADMEVDGDGATDEHETEQALDGANNNGDEVLDNAASDGEWEMVTEETEPAPAAEASAEPPHQEPAAAEVGTKAEPKTGGADTKKLMEMVATLCEQNAQQCAVIGALAERVDALERTVRRVEDAERRRQRAKKLKKGGKGNNQTKCCID
ncbi:hypothetical protein PR202_gb12949 [Eleusine coracana subsp. coracana]|uniref:BAG domain-containing protein n=1 Tax=Eleusine coracana subsp. coracana TaxID=191504 RepID=A0AAV5EQQ5_ELECO|nr:hypothetical protein QOZ80_9BG0708290 [Eleusine coracana subsp. coracana]GJN25157.1 hypothetical protein PR202_gb12949 [Eleusine coracana subsp. coracana]